jgi:hypothetical protein
MQVKGENISTGEEGSKSLDLILIIRVLVKSFMQESQTWNKC